jgi:MFS family permease
VFAAGSFLAAMAQDIHMVIVGRIIQGAGAISSAVIALTADLTRDEQRTKAMAIIGVTIGATFALSMVAGPVLGRSIAFRIFALTGAGSGQRWRCVGRSRSNSLRSRVRDAAGVAGVFRTRADVSNLGIFCMRS